MAPLVAPWDADNMWLPTKLKRQVAMLDAIADLNAVFCHVTEFVVDQGVVDGVWLHRPHERIHGCVASALLIWHTKLDDISGLAANDHL